MMPAAAPHSPIAIQLDHRISRSPAEIESEMGVPILAVVPPAPELSTLGERTRLPIMQSDPQSLVAEGFLTLAHRFPRQTSRPRR